MNDADPYVIAFHLPQYHPIPENDLWWGRGFTEWTNTAKARPLFPGHYQPHVPADLGFYDLRLPEARAAQAELAREYGVSAFCYYHYWFAGKQLLEAPVQALLKSGEPDFPFCLCWANQTWTGVWHGAPNRVLIEQTYPGVDDYRRHFETLLPAFADPRYVKVDGKPVFVVYRPNELPDPQQFTDCWRELAIKAGFPGMYFVAVHLPQWDPMPQWFDAAIVTRFPAKRREWVSWSEPLRKIQGKLLDLRGMPTIYAYSKVMDSFLSEPVPGITSFPCVVPNWDNTPRSGSRGLVLHGSTPALFARHMRAAVEKVKRELPEGLRFIFVKSWNEWAEGNHLEPDLKFGRAYLEALRDELAR